MQGQLKSEAALLLEVFSRIFQNVEAKALLASKVPAEAGGSSTRQAICSSYCKKKHLQHSMPNTVNRVQATMRTSKEITKFAWHTVNWASFACASPWVHITCKAGISLLSL